ncbi:MAG: hypothetical protein K1X88_19390 [Nannocystaceae bacterium]|nr:hypothetical protein [Nannocystaceae bacterium]
MQPSEAAFRVRVACEDNGHFEVVRVLASLTLREHLAWFEDVEPHVLWEKESITDARRRARERGVARLHGHFGGVPGEADALMVRAQLLLWDSDAWAFDFAVLARDTDGDRARRNGACQAVAENALRVPSRPPIVLAYAEPEIEAWVIAGFIARDDAEQRRLHAELKRLGFDPRSAPERLTAKRHSDARDAKAVLVALCGSADAQTRWVRCADASLERWREHTKAAGGPEFLDAVRHEVVPALRRTPAAPST